MKVFKIISISILLFLVKTILTFFIDFYNIIDAPAKIFPRDSETGGFWSYSKVYVTLEFIYGIWIYIAVVALFYFLCKTRFFVSWKKKFWLGFFIVIVMYLTYASFEEPIIINHALREHSYRGLNMKFVKGIVTYIFIGICLPFLSKKVKLI